MPKTRFRKEHLRSQKIAEGHLNLKLLYATGPWYPVKKTFENLDVDENGYGDENAIFAVQKGEDFSD